MRYRLNVNVCGPLDSAAPQTCDNVPFFPEPAGCCLHPHAVPGPAFAVLGRKRDSKRLSQRLDRHTNRIVSYELACYSIVGDVNL